jgi:GNAT superfamily N-acetyltransferase
LAVGLPSDVDEMARLLAVAFTRFDPPAIAVGLEVDDFEAFVRLLAAPALPEGLSVVAREASTGAMVGALLNDDGAAPLAAGLDRLSVRFDPIFDLLGQLHEGDPVSTTRGELLHCSLLGVAPDHFGRGIARQLVGTSIANAVRLGFRTALTEATNPASQHVFAGHGFTVRASLRYADYRRDGRAVFAAIADQGGPMLMVRDFDGP